jgi:cell division protein FtsZ
MCSHASSDKLENYSAEVSRGRGTVKSSRVKRRKKELAKITFTPTPAKIRAIGVGGGGCNAINRMVRASIEAVEFVGINADAQALALCEAPTRLQIGEKLTKGLGTGGDHILGRKAAEESRDEIRQQLSGADMIFITAGMGGGTGTGAIPLIAEMSRESGALTIGIVTRPFTFEGVHRSAVAEEGIKELTPKVDTLITIPNDRLLILCERRMNVDSAFKMADDVLRQGVEAISGVITVPGLINLDFADVRAVMKDAGPAWLSIGEGRGHTRAVDAARSAIASPLLDISIEGATGVLFYIDGGKSLTLQEVNEAAEIIGKAVDPGANIIFGVSSSAEREDEEMRLILIATGFSREVGPTPLLTKEEQHKLLKDLGDESTLDIPSFLRRPSFVRRAEIPPLVAKPIGLSTEASES